MSPIKKILLVQLYSNGDCLYATAIARQIKSDYPNSHLTWAIASFNKAIIENNPYVDRIWSIDTISKTDSNSIRKFNKEVISKKKQGLYDEVFIVHNADKNHAFYDGSIRASILNAYPHPITVPVQPVLRNTDVEINNVSNFVKTKHLSNYENVILFEFAPQSGQIKIADSFAISIAESLVKDGKTAVILSSAKRIIHENNAIIDGSILSLRETALLTHHCTFLIGCSSGITWISTSDASKLLPMLQLLDPNVLWFNPISRDFKRFEIGFDKVIEIANFNKDIIIDCVKTALTDFYLAKEKYHQSFKISFRTSRTIVYAFLYRCDLMSIAKHIKVNIIQHGFNLSFMKQVLIAFCLFPIYMVNVMFLGKK